MLPLSDNKKIKKTPIITILLIFINTVLFFLMQANFYDYGFVPGDFNFFKIISSMFLHVNFWHLFVNMWFLWIFGTSLEDKLGKIKFLCFYLLCGIFSGLMYFFFITSSLTIPIFGASGAISGILGAYLFLFPKAKIRAFPNFKFPAFVYIVAWFILQLIFMYLGGGDVAYLGHVGGFISGIILIMFFK